VDEWALSTRDLGMRLRGRGQGNFKFPLPNSSSCLPTRWMGGVVGVWSYVPPMVCQQAFLRGDMLGNGQIDWL